MSYHLIKEFEYTIGFKLSEKFVVQIDFNPDVMIEDNSSEYSENVKKQITEYLLGKKHELSFPIKLSISDFQKQVLEAMRLIPYGKTMSYEEIAKLIGKPNASRAVGNACGANPIPLYFPCHRIVKKNGNLGGFSGGVDVKKWLLSLENKHNQ